MHEVCKCGQEILKIHINPFTNQEENLCSECLSQALLAVHDMESDLNDPEEIIELLEGGLE